MIRTIFGNIVIAAFLFLFVAANLAAWRSSANIGYLLVAINEGIYVALYIVRQPAVATTTSAFDWGVAFSAAFLGTLLRPASAFNIPLGDTLILVGIAINVVSVLYLNRSIALVPALRTIQTRGPYRVVRHPMYASEIATFFGYLFVNASLLNVFLVVASTAFMIIRIDREEAFLSRSDAYRTYLKTVPWKLVPFVY